MISLVILFLSLTIPVIYRFVRKRLSWKSHPFLLGDDSPEGEGEDVEEVLSPAPAAMPSSGLIADFKAHVRSLQEFGSILFALEIVRTLTLCALLGLSIYAAIKAEAPDQSPVLGDVEIMKKHWGKGKKKHKHKNKHGHKGHHDKSVLDEYSSLEWGEFGACAFYVSRVDF